MPLPKPGCIIPEDVCCTTFFDIAENIKDAVLLVLLECAGEETPCKDPWIGYVTMGTGDDGITDALTVAIGSVSPSFAAQQTGTLKGPAQMVISYMIRILESGWPMAYEDSTGLKFPDPDVQNALARHAFSDGQRMYTKLFSMARDRSMLPAGAGCANVTLGPLTPIAPLGGVVGFYATMTVTLTGW